MFAFRMLLVRSATITLASLFSHAGVADLPAHRHVQNLQPLVEEWI